MVGAPVSGRFGPALDGHQVRHGRQRRDLKVVVVQM